MTVPGPCFLVGNIATVTVRTLQEMSSFPPVPSSRHVALTDTSVGTEQARSTLFPGACFPGLVVQDVRWGEVLQTHPSQVQGEEIACLTLALWPEQHTPARLLGKSDVEGCGRGRRMPVQIGRRPRDPLRASAVLHVRSPWSPGKGS